MFYIYRAAKHCSRKILVFGRQIRTVIVKISHSIHLRYLTIVVYREILFNKRLNKSRKELEDISDATLLNLRRVTRQYDNVKRILNAFEEACTSQWMNAYTFVTKHFKLNDNQARKYACIIFHIISKFNLTTKRRLQRVSNEDIEDCAGLIISFLAADINLFTTESLKAFTAVVGEMNGNNAFAQYNHLIASMYI